MKTTLISAHCPKCKRVQEFTVAQDIERNEAKKICGLTVCNQCAEHLTGRWVDLQEVDPSWYEKKAEVLAPRLHTDFDFEEIYRRFGERDDSTRDHAIIAQFVGQILRWIVRGKSLTVITRRAKKLQRLLEKINRNN